MAAAAPDPFGLPPLVTNPVGAPPRPYRRLQEDLGGLFDDDRRRALGQPPLSAKVLDFISFTEGEADSIYAKINQVSNLLDWIWYLLRQYADSGMSQSELDLLKRYIRRLFSHFGQQMDEHDVRKAEAIKSFLESVVPAGSPAPMGDDGRPLPTPIQIDPNNLHQTLSGNPAQTPWRWGYQGDDKTRVRPFVEDPLLPGVTKYIPGAGEVVPAGSMYRPYVQEPFAGTARELLLRQPVAPAEQARIDQEVQTALAARLAERQAAVNRGAAPPPLRAPGAPVVRGGKRKTRKTRKSKQKQKQKQKKTKSKQKQKK